MRWRLGELAKKERERGKRNRIWKDKYK